jgi:hypothetical protein
VTGVAKRPPRTREGECNNGCGEAPTCCGCFHSVRWLSFVAAALWHKVLHGVCLLGVVVSALLFLLCGLWVVVANVFRLFCCCVVLWLGRVDA